MDPMKLDPTEQRILGVLIEKELAVPDNYPLTQNALVAGCNQKNNRDPLMALEEFQVSGALASLLEKRLVLRVSQAGARTVRFKHQCDPLLGLGGREKAVLAELLLRGPQAPGALKPRLVRMGVAAGPAEILAVLEGLRARSDGPLVEQLPREPRQRDQRWQHLLGGEFLARSTPEALGSAAGEPEVPDLVVPEAPGGEADQGSDLT